jgi:hypothetical protein
MGVIINGGLNVNSTGTTINTKPSTSISVGLYSRINQNGSININTDPAFGYVPPPLSTNLEVRTLLGPIISVSIGGAPPYIIQNGTLPVYDTTYLTGHHFGGTSITIEEAGNANVVILVNNLTIIGGGTCANPNLGTFTVNYTFTEQDYILIRGDDCAG